MSSSLRAWHLGHLRRNMLLMRTPHLGQRSMLRLTASPQFGHFCTCPFLLEEGGGPFTMPLNRSPSPIASASVDSAVDVVVLQGHGLDVAEVRELVDGVYAAAEPAV